MRGLPRLPLRGDRRPRSQPSWNRHNKGGQRGGKNSPQAVSDLSCVSMSRRRGKPRLYSKGQLTSSAEPLLPNPRRVPARLRPGRQPPEESEPAAAACWRSSSAWALRPAAALFRPKAAGRRSARPQLPFPAGSVQVLFAVKLHTHFSCLGTCVLEQGIKRRVWVSPALCQGKQGPRDKSDYRNTTTATRTPRIRTTIANRLTWFASHDSREGTAFRRKAGTNSSSIAAAEADAVSCPGSRCAVSLCSFSRAFFPASFCSQSRQSVLPSETGNPQEAHFSTRSIASGTETGTGNDDPGNGDGISGGSAGTAGGSASSGSTSAGSTSSGSTSAGFSGTLTGS